MASNKAGTLRHWLVLIGCCFMQAGGLGAVLDAAGVFFVPICEDLGFLRSEISMYLTFYFIATVFAMPIVGKWITKYNINVVLSVAFALTAGAVAAMSFYNEPWQWWISGAIFGLAGSFIFVIPTPILIGNWFDKHRGLALGVAMSFSGIGGAILSPLFTIFIQNFGWRTAYLIAAAIMAILVLPWTLFVFKLHPEDIGLRPYGWTGEDNPSAVDETQHDRIQFSGVPARLAIKTVPFWAMFLMAGFVAYFAGFNSHLPGYAQSIGFSALFGSTLLTAVMVGNVVEKLIIGWLNDKIGVRITVYIQLVMVIIGLIGLIFSGGNPILMYVSAFFFGAQNSLYSVSIPLLTRMLFGERDFPKIFAWTKIGTGVIGCIGPVSIGAIYDVTGSFVPAFGVGIGVALASAACVLVAEIFAKKLKWYEAGEPDGFTA